MSMTQFIKEYQEEIDYVIKNMWHDPLTFENRVLAVMNEYRLYSLAVDRHVTYHGERI